MPLPVMIFIHGGGFQSGSGNVTHYGPDFLVSHGVVLVTMNYRLEALGFLCLDTEEVPGNAGLKDQVAALRWVKENIKNFGGDPDNVTVFGESAGGTSTAYHVVSPLSSGLFKRAISMSGVPSCDWAYPFMPAKRAFILGKLLGKETDDPQELLEFLQSVPAEKLVNTKPNLTTLEEWAIHGLKFNYFTPVVEKDFEQEHFITENPFEILKKGKANQVDLLIGNTSEEGLIASLDKDNILKQYNRYHEMLVPREIAIQSNSETISETADKIHNFYFGNSSIGEHTLQKMITHISDASFLYNIHRFVSKIQNSENISNKFYYVFSCVSERNFYGNKGAVLGLHGASHLDDLMYLFDAKFLSQKYDKSSREHKLIELVNTVFTNFAKYGTPTPDKSLGIIWPQYNNSTKLYVDIGDALTIGANYKAKEFDFWRSLFEYAGVEF